MEYYYFPILKSRDSELRAYKELSNEDKKKILPILELTRSRITPRNRNGSIEKKMEEVVSIFAGSCFILDLTTEETLDNDQIQDLLLSNENGYEKWVNFVNQYKSRVSFIPTIHFNPDCIDDVLKQIEVLSSNFSTLALRLNALDTDNRMYLEKIQDHLHKCIVILDAENQDRDFNFFKYIKAISDLEIKAIIYAYSCFPATVPISNEGEVKKYTLGPSCLYEEFQNVYYGDYALTTARRYDMQARGWIPRIDIPNIKNSKLEFWYCRYRTSDQFDTERAYIECAKKLYSEIGILIDEKKPTWGEKVFLDAKDGYVAGKSPSFWISVRNNIYISKMIANCVESSRRILKL
ncbi:MULTISPECIES: beta family protein [unclassified Helicobacter]|uniref:beta family protein n=1 Tax=unclassified Helicobacter TaxID=2593540 RepID=UPI000CF03D3E|nr:MULTISPECIES: hypothetical protein [unclassified Helicobacter]